MILLPVTLPMGLAELGVSSGYLFLRLAQVVAEVVCHLAGRLGPQGDLWPARVTLLLPRPKEVGEVLCANRMVATDRLAPSQNIHWAPVSLQAKSAKRAEKAKSEVSEAQSIAPVEPTDVRSPVEPKEPKEVSEPLSEAVVCEAAELPASISAAS